MQELLADQLLLPIGRQMDVCVLHVAFSCTDPGDRITFDVTTDPDLRMLDQQLVKLVTELDERLFGGGLLGVLNHV